MYLGLVSEAIVGLFDTQVFQIFVMQFGINIQL